MFCPNCGAQVDTKFCPNCGTPLQQTGSSGNVSLENATVLSKIPLPPPGKYASVKDYIQTTEEGIILYKKIPFTGDVTRTISYADIIAVDYVPSKGLGLGRLAIREKKDQHIPLPSALDAASDPTTITFMGGSDNKLFRQLYDYLKPLADRNAAAFIPTPAKQTDTVQTVNMTSQSGIDLEPYFQQYYPGRMNAVKALHHDSGFTLQECKDLIDQYFDANKHRAPVRNVDIGKEFTRHFNPEKAAKNERKEQLDSQGVAYCPKCLSTSIGVKNRGFSLGKGIAGSLVSPGVGLLAGAAGANKPECVCLKCGHKWKP